MTEQPDSTPSMISYTDVSQVVHLFYAQLLEHPQLSHFFQNIENFSSHEQRISDFWWLVLGGRLDQKPDIDMIGKHMPLGIENKDLEIWLAIFTQTLQQSLTPAAASLWLNKVELIASRLRQIVIQQKPSGIQITETKS